MVVLNPFVAMQASLYRSTGGRLAGSLRGAPVMLLTTTGRKSGKLRTTPVLFIRQGDSIFTVASNGGKDRHPTWWLNLRANPEAQVQIKREVVPVRARKASPEEHERLWPMLVKMYPGYAGYQKKTKRVIPIVVLERR